MVLLNNRLVSKRVAGIFLLAALLPCAVTGEPAPAPGHEIKAGFVYNFAKLTTWPSNAFEDASAPIRIGVIGADGLADYLEAKLKNRTIEGRTLAVARLEPCSLVTNHHIVFVSASASSRLPDFSRAIGHLPILTIGESKDFTSQGGIIRLFKQRGALRFEINRKASRRAGLVFSSRLLALTRVNSEESR